MSTGATPVPATFEDSSGAERSKRGAVDYERITIDPAKINLSPQVARLLAAAGHDAVAVRDLGCRTPLTTRSSTERTSRIA